MATWNGTGAGTFEGEPRGTTDAGTTDETFKALKQETRLRGAVEHDWSDGTVSGDPKGANDNGRHRAGSARAFYAASDPTALNIVQDTASSPSNALGASDDGRLLVRSDQAERLKVWDGSAWQNVGIGSLDNVGDVDLTTDAPDIGDLLQYDGTNFIPVSPAVSSTLVSTPQNITMASPATSEAQAFTTVTGLTATIVVPSTGQYYIRVSLTVSGQRATGGQFYVWFDSILLENIDGGGANEVTRQRSSGRDPEIYGQGVSNSISYAVVPAVAGSTYVYTAGARAASNVAGTFDLQFLGGSAPNQGNHTSSLIAELIPYTT